ncbi:lipocalin family protein [Aureisphaera galaxeae]|uniref:lipocalin family protein n=1 Tax=Aureisphaera galaxeae TaxID=1538023 RepID=UPI002350F631|nr:lipocalin family protein [Aureisphaera galaxeae]MDC8004848.1 lipocalin family protein [Aureisphaera galaxeae]
MAKLISVLAILVALSACSGKKEEEVYVLPEKAEFLLASDTLKTWKIAKRYNGKARMNMEPEGCFIKYKQTFFANDSVIDNNEQHFDCGPSLKGTWEITQSAKGHSYIKLSSSLLPELLGTDKDYKYFKILYLSKDSLTLSFSHTQYGKKRTITDYLVRDDLDIGDRSFHY